MGFTALNTTPEVIRLALGAADIDAENGKITPRRELKNTDFADIWWVGDYSDQNGETNGGYVAIHMMNALSTGGFAIKSSDNGKGNFAFTYTAHYSMDAQETVPFEVYVKAGTTE